MRRIIFSLLFAFFINAYADNPDLNIETFTPVEISNLFDKNNNIDLERLVNLVEKEEKIGVCIEDYIKKQSKSYTKIVQNTLYDLIHNFDRIASEIYGKKLSSDKMSYEDKIEALARIQCEAYYTMGMLK
jgi:hypothetical protein